MLKKIIVLFSCLLLIVSIVGCAGNPSTPETTFPIEETEPSTITVEEESIPLGTAETEPTIIETEESTEPAHVHTYEETVVDATCTTDGYTTYTCECGNTYTDNTVAATGHTYETTTVKATYTTKGYDEHICSVCNNSYRDNYVDVIPHEHEYKTKETKPSCTKKGYTTYTCKLCDKSYKENYVEAPGHNYVKSVIAPTYTEKGYDLYKCSVCKDSYKDNYVDVVPHNCDYKEKTVQPTCTKSGSISYTCKLCNKSKDSTSIAALGHDYTTETIAPTAKEKGYDVHTCSRCKDTYKDNYTDPVVTYKEVNEKVYAKSEVNIRTGPSTDYKKLGSLAKGKSITRVGIGDNGWSKVMYNDEVAYISSNYLTTEEPPAISASGYPKTYSDSTAKITITKEWYKNSWCYIAHLEFSDYSRFGSTCGNNKLNSGETTSHAAKRVGAIFAVNGPYMGKEYSVVRHGKVFYDVPIIADLAIYNVSTGKLENAGDLGLTGMKASTAVEKGLVSDTFKFYNSTLVKGGKNVANPNNNDRAQRTFIGTTGKAGDIYVIVSEGRKADGKSGGLRKYDCANLLVNLGCSYGVMLDGGGSSTMYFNGKVLNSANGNQRAVIDFVYFK